MKKLTFALLGVLLFSSSSNAAEWGTIKGSVLLDDEVPDPALLIKKDATVDEEGNKVTDPAVCSALDIYANDLVVNSDTKGIANVFIYLYKPPKDIHPGSTEVPKVVTFDQKNCVFKPHALVLQAGQTVEVLNSDEIAHNTHSNPFKNQQQNILVPANSGKGDGVLFPTAVGESVPFKVNCDIHPAMKAYWMVTAHPYCAVTDEKGNFTIKNLPVGKHEFRVWHERPGYLDRKYKVTVAAGDNEPLKPLTVKLTQLEVK